MIHSLIVHPANIQDRAGAKMLFDRMGGALTHLKKVFADDGYSGKLVKLIEEKKDWLLEIVKRNEKHKFVVLPKRWIVERTFGWLGRSRRLSKDYEASCSSSECMIYLAMIRLMLKRLTN
jgi:putative transposase